MLDEQKNLDDILPKGGWVYFVGIGGIAMSAVANMAAQLGYEVFGSDSKEVYAPAKDVLDHGKINYVTGYSEANIKAHPADLYILSAGEDMNNREVKYIIENDLPRAGFAELLYYFAEEKLRVVVTGTHGKSTTAGLLGHLFKNLDNSSFIVGGVLQNYESNFSLGDGHYFVFEGDEYKNQFDDPTPKFHYYKPDILVLTNLEYDHPDIFPNIEALEQEFRLLIEKLPEDGLIVYNADNAILTRLVHESNVASVSFAIDNEADFKADQIQYGSEYTTIEVINKFSKAVSAKLLGQTEQYKIQLAGRLYAYNALAAIATLRALGFAQEQIALDLLTYKGIKRRFELVGVKNGVTLIDDYAHHPTAVRETLEAARLRFFPPLPLGEDAPMQRGAGEGSQGRLWAVFEPHTFSRTQATLGDLAKSFGSADQVLISEIYPAREKAKDHNISSEEVVKAIRNSSPSPSGRGIKGEGFKVRLVHDKTEALGILKKELKPGDVVIVMAVGNFNRLAYELKEML